MLRKLLCMALALAFVAFAGCGKNEGTDNSLVPESSAEESSDIEQSENSDDNSQDVEEPQDKNYVEEINKLLGDADRSKHKKNLLLNKGYTADIAADKSYPDSKRLLTDGKTPLSFSSNEEWAGYIFNTADAKNCIEFDLGAETEGLLDFSVWALDLEGYAIYAPKTVRVYVAGKDKNFIKVGTAHRNDGDLNQNSAIKYNLFLQGAVKAKYVRFEIAAAKKGWCFIGEAEAFAYSDTYDEYYANGESLNDYYGYNGIPEITEEKYWDKGDDYDKVQNLIKLKTPIISAGEYVSADLLTNWYNTKSTTTLTNGTLASKASISDAAWFHITRGESRTITVDMGKISAVSGFESGFLCEADTGVRFPGDIRIKLSLNGKDWQTVYKDNGPETENAEDIFRYDIDFGKEYKARYVQLSFTVNTHTYIDEFAVKAKKNAEKALDLVADKPEEEEKPVYDNYAMPEDLCDVNNMLLSYHCILDGAKNSSENGLITPEEYLPHVAYLDKEGNIKDTFFDAYLYLPYTSLIHGAGSDYGRSADGWRSYVDDMFYKDRNMDALEACAETVYTELGRKGEKLKVFTSILYTFPKLYGGQKNSFGDIDGDGVNEDFDTLEGRKTADKWMMDQEYNRFKERNYQNLDFCGFYWFEESIDYNNVLDREVITFAVDYAHSLGVKIFWIPYNSADGINKWDDLGFDVACIQPNYMFNDVKADILYETAERASNLGMCVELEINDPNNLIEANKYMEYLIAGAETGYMNGIKMYYQVGVPGAFHAACYSEKPEVRSIYDSTYLFAKGEFKPTRPEDVVISDTPLEYEYNENGTVSGGLKIDWTEAVSGKFAVVLSPKYGSVKLSSDGFGFSFEYFPAEGYTGEDSFEIIFDLGYGEPIPTVIKIKAK